MGACSSSSHKPEQNTRNETFDAAIVLQEPNQPAKTEEIPEENQSVNDPILPSAVPDQPFEITQERYFEFTDDAGKYEVKLCYKIYNVHSAGIPLIMICGRSRVKEDWHEEFPSLLAKQSNRPVLTYDARGLGKSIYNAVPGPNKADHLKKYELHDVAEEIYKLGHEAFPGSKKVHILGFSYGGYVAQHVLLKYADYVHSAILTGTCLTIFEPKSPTAGKQLWGDALWTAWARFMLDEEWLQEDNNKQLYDKWFALEMKQNRPEDALVAQYFAGINHHTKVQDFESIHSPILAVHGAKDRVIPLREAESFKKVAKIEFAVIENAGHNYWLMNLPDSLRVIVDWLNKTS
jgi:pimeloyl-ACP methyl ester carboxylesterase